MAAVVGLLAWLLVLGVFAGSVYFPADTINADGYPDRKAGAKTGIALQEEYSQEIPALQTQNQAEAVSDGELERVLMIDAGYPSEREQQLSSSVDATGESLENPTNGMEDEIPCGLYACLLAHAPDREITVAILDTGVNAAVPELSGRVLPSAWNLTEEGERDSVADLHGHGTLLARLVAQNSDEMVKILPVKVAGQNGSARLGTVCEGIRIAQSCGADVILLSMNTLVSTESLALSDAIHESVQNGVPVVVSAGNRSRDTRDIAPANVSEALVISAVDKEGRFAPYSNYGESVDFAACGEFEGKSGTSYAAARFAGILADALCRKLSLSDLSAYAADCGPKGRDPYYGIGRIERITRPRTAVDAYMEKLFYVETPPSDNDIRGMGDFRDYSDAEIDARLGNSDLADIGYYLSRLQPEELSELLARDTQLARETDFFTGKYEGEDLEETLRKTGDFLLEQKENLPFYRKCLLQYEEDAKTLTVSQFLAKKMGKFRIRINNSYQSSQSGAVTVNVRFVGSAATQTPEGYYEVGDGNMAVQAQDSSTAMTAWLSNSSYSIRLTSASVRSGANSDGQVYAGNIFYATYSMLLPAYCRSANGGSSHDGSCPQGTRMSFETYDLMANGSGTWTVYPTAADRWVSLSTSVQIWHLGINTPATVANPISANGCVLNLNVYATYLDVYVNPEKSGYYPGCEQSTDNLVATIKNHDSFTLSDATPFNYSAYFHTNGSNEDPACFGDGETIKSVSTKKKFTGWAIKSGSDYGTLEDHTVTAKDINADHKIVIQAKYSGSYRVQIPLGIPTRRGYRFTGWSADGGTTLYGVGDLVTLSEDTVFYAVWEPIEYQLTYYANAGAIGGSNAVLYQNRLRYRSTGILDPRADAQGVYRFIGWAFSDKIWVNEQELWTHIGEHIASDRVDLLARYSLPYSGIDEQASVTNTRIGGNYYGEASLAALGLADTDRLAKVGRYDGNAFCESTALRGELWNRGADVRFADGVDYTSSLVLQDMAGNRTILTRGSRGNTAHSPVGAYETVKDRLSMTLYVRRPGGDFVAVDTDQAQITRVSSSSNTLHPAETGRYTVEWNASEVRMGWNQLQFCSAGSVGCGVPEGYRIQSVTMEGATADTNRLTRACSGAEGQCIPVAIYCVPKTYTVTFLANGGNFADGSDQLVTQVEYGERALVPLVDRTGYAFTGWKDQYGRESTDTPVTEPLTFTAQYEARDYAYAVIYDAGHNGGTIDGKEQITLAECGKRVSVGQSVPFAPCASMPERTDRGYVYRFIGWTLDPSGSPENGALLITGQEEMNRAVVLSEAMAEAIDKEAARITLYAVYAYTYTITYVDACGKREDASFVVYNRKRGVKAHILEPRYADGWCALDPSGGGWSYSTAAVGEGGLPEVSVAANSDMILTDDITLYALYKKDIKLRYETGYEQIAVPDEGATVYHNAACAPDSDAPYTFSIRMPGEMEHMSFDYWYEGGNGETRYAPQERIDAASALHPHYTFAKTITLLKDATLTAHWDAVQLLYVPDALYSLAEAQSGTITEAELLRHVETEDADPRSGDLSDQVEVQLIGFDTHYFEELGDDAELRITYRATDSFGHVITQRAAVRVVDTAPKPARQKTNIRFISSEYLDKTPEEGGLHPNSFWVTKDAYRERLLEAFAKWKEIKEQEKEEPGADESSEEGDVSEPSENPEPGETSESSDNPEPGEEPGTSEAPEPGEEPGTSEAPESGETPEPGEKPETSEKPEPGEDTESSEEPGTSELPEEIENVVHSCARDGHSYAQILKTTASCVQNGIEVYVCTYCQSTQTQIAEPALGHDFSAKKADVIYLCNTADCEHPATYYCSCTRCGEVGAESFAWGNAIGHDFSQKVVHADYLRSEATCTVPATYYYACRTCRKAGAAFYLSGETRSHTWVERPDEACQKSAATCTEPASFYFRCSECNTMSEAFYSLGAAAGHRFCAERTEDRYIAQMADCTNPSLYFKSCEVCGTCGTETFVYGSSSGHNYNKVLPEERYLINPATCESRAVYAYACSGCGQRGERTYEAGSALGHEFTSCTATDAYRKSGADCVHAAEYYLSCVRCGKKGEETFSFGSALGHSFTRQVRDTRYLRSAQSCTEPESFYYLCVRCDCCSNTQADAKYYTTKESLGHSYRTQTIAATCTSMGYEKHTCTRCQETYNDHFTADLGHHEVFAGTRDVHTNCSRCGYVMSTAHTMTSGVETEATCTAKGKTRYSCVCGYTYVLEDRAALGHAYADGICSRCGSIKDFTGISLEQATWGEIHMLTQRNLFSAYYRVGDTKTVTAEGKTVMVRVSEIGDGYADFVSTDILGTHYMYNQNVVDSQNPGPVDVGWAYCDLRGHLNNDVFPTLPSELQTVISPRTYTVNRQKLCYEKAWLDGVYGYWHRYDESTVTVSDKLWIPSYEEVASGMYRPTDLSGVMWTNTLEPVPNKANNRDNFGTADWYVTDFGTTNGDGWWGDCGNDAAHGYLLCFRL